MTEDSSFSLILGNSTLFLQDYLPSDAVEAFHILPRFSHHDDFSALFSENQDEVKDYALGLLFIPCLVSSFFILWAFLLLIFKCLGPRYLGVFSGYPYQQYGCYSQSGRIIFTFSAIIVMTFTVLSIMKGLRPLESARETMDATNQDVMKIHNEFLNISESLQQISRQAIPVRDQIVTFLKADICPLQSGFSNEFSNELEIRQIGADTLAALEELSDFAKEDMLEVSKALRTLERATEDVGSSLDDMQFTNGMVALAILPYFIMPALLLFTLLLGWTESYFEEFYVCSTWILMPIFTLMVIFASAASSFAFLVAQGNADFCAGGSSPLETPEATIQSILGRSNFTEGVFYHDAIIFYANQCTTESPWGYLDTYYEDLNAAKSNLDAMAAVIKVYGAQDLSQECGVEYSPALELITQLKSYMTILLDASERNMELIACPKIVPLYTSSVYEATCQDAITASTWVFACAFVIAFFGMIMVMFRGAYYPLYFWDDFLESDSFEKPEDEYSTASSNEMDLQEHGSEDFPEESYIANGTQLEPPAYGGEVHNLSTHDVVENDIDMDGMRLVELDTEEEEDSILRFRR